MKTETAQRILWFAMIFIILTIIAVIGAAIGFALAIEFVDLGSFITDPTVLSIIETYPLLIPGMILVLALLGIIYLAIIYMWRKDPMAHRTGFTILGIIQLLIGFNLVGLLILLPGLLMEEQ
ncbi:MAG: hypothetical protein EAX95_13920 [Candidatus Thorarchaeota archaeon]|nr:hypothetical protein [Candidatus Thorarchaeota archaeon]